MKRFFIHSREIEIEIEREREKETNKERRVNKSILYGFHKSLDINFSCVLKKNYSFVSRFNNYYEQINKGNIHRLDYLGNKQNN